MAKLHRQLGHPNNSKLVCALCDANINEAIVKEAVDYECDVCKPGKALEKPAALRRASYFNEVIEMDTFHIKWDGAKRKILAPICFLELGPGGPPSEARGDGLGFSASTGEVVVGLVMMDFFHQSFCPHNQWAMPPL